MTFAQRLNQHWRLHATGFAFASFGVGALFLGFTWFPLLRLVTWNRETLRRRARLTLHYSFKFFVGMMRLLGLLTYQLHDVERLRMAAPSGGRLVIANHPSLIDVVFLVSLIPDADCIVKRALWKNPFLRWPVVWAGYIPNDEGEALVQHCAAALARGGKLVVFPEGTRTQPGKDLVFKRGVAQILLHSPAEVQPVTIRCQPSTLTKAEKWWHIPPQRPHWDIWAEDILPASRFAVADATASVAARSVTRDLLDYYQARLAQRCG